MFTAFEGATSQETITLYGALVASLIGGSKGEGSSTATTLKDTVDAVLTAKSNLEEGLPDEED